MIEQLKRYDLSDLDRAHWLGMLDELDRFNAFGLSILAEVSITAVRQLLRANRLPLEIKHAILKLRTDLSLGLIDEIARCGSELQQRRILAEIASGASVSEIRNARQRLA